MPTGIEVYPSPYVSKLCKILKVLFAVHLILGVIGLLSDVFSGLMMLIGALMLFYIIKRLNWCLGLIYMLVMFLELISGIFYIGTVLSMHLSNEKTEINSLVGAVMLKVPLYTVSIYYTFLTYKELKALYIENAQNAGLELPQRDNRGNSAQNRNYND